MSAHQYKRVFMPVEGSVPHYVQSSDESKDILSAAQALMEHLWWGAN